MADEPEVRLTYHGGDADSYAMDMRLLGQSLQGADEIMSDGLITLIHGRPPKRGERAPVVAKVREPVAGSYDMWGFWESAYGLLPLAAPVAEAVLSGFIEQWWITIKAKFTGKPDVAEKAIEAMAQMNRDHLSARDAEDARAHERQLAMIAALRETLAGQQRSLEKFVAPIGPSVQSAEITPRLSPPVVVSNDDADEIREFAKLSWEPLAELRLRTDGFKFHTNGLSIENPEKNGFLMARVLDPKFEEMENVYTEAAQRKSEIIVLARRGYKDGKLVRIDIVEFINEIAA